LRHLLGFSTAAGGADVVEGDGACAEEDEGEGQGGQGEGGFISADQAAVDVIFGDGDGEIDADSECRDAGEEAEQDEQGAKEFGEGGDVGGPGGETEAGNKLGVVVESAENFVVSVEEHDEAQGEAHDEEGEGLQAVEVAHVVPPAKEGLRLQQRGGGGKQAKVT